MPKSTIYIPYYVGTATSFLNQVLHLGPAVNQRGGARRARHPRGFTECLAYCSCTGQTPHDPRGGGGKATPHPCILPPPLSTCKTKKSRLARMEVGFKWWTAGTCVTGRWCPSDEAQRQSEFLCKTVRNYTFLYTTQCCTTLYRTSLLYRIIL